ncbi:DM13 domain-containing protein [Staphylococcus simulans]|uniref:DM13 domain-containing protein n=1 Tax=Staphylococcus simulans TaxID=1286 RepID=UPI0029030060|nr:DM13 domain-containing protein [Staphylococcus simulans]MDU0420203.1 DM13 domain-containing protein [Staphylococcus simulans]MDU0466061.1 DM13 domain-containing protein [Staphylococcus simulans]
MNSKTYLLATTLLATSITLAGCNNEKDEQPKEKTEQTSHEHKHNHHKVLTGEFKSGEFKSGEEEVSGHVKIENHQIKLTDFKSAKGPDLYVYLTKDGNIKEGKQLEMVDYNKPKQTFDIKDADLDQYNEVTIYCKKAHVIFGAAKVK